MTNTGTRKAAALWTWTRRGLTLGGLLLAVGMVRGQSGSITDFEMSSNLSLSSDVKWLSWGLVAPGWSHAPGANTIFVTRGLELSSQTQSYFLVDSSSQWSPLAGQYSLGLSSGHYSATDPNSAWVPAYIEEHVTVPEDAQSFRMLALGNVSLSFDSKQAPLFNLGGDSYGADVSALAGQSVTIRIENDSNQVLNPVIVDNIGFSPATVPEPSTFQFAVCGFVVLALVLRRRSQRA